MNDARAAAAGVAAAMVWAAVEPLDKRLFRYDYSDIAMLGKAVTRSRAWPIAGLAVHAANGAVFGIVARRLRVNAVALALVENTVLFPLGAIVDRVHPARGQRGVAPMFTVRGFAQETARHILFGAVLERLLREEAE